MDNLKKQYNEALKRYNDMEEWIKTATPEEQKQMGNHVAAVINKCNDLLNEIKELDLIAPGEILGGFKI